jgi:hypothetical protein
MAEAACSASLPHDLVIEIGHFKDLSPAPWQIEPGPQELIGSK